MSHFIRTVLVAAAAGLALLGLTAAPKSSSAAATPGLWALTGRAASSSPAQAHQPATPIKHVVVIFLENHSFDNVLGLWCDHNRSRCPQGGMPASITLQGGIAVSPSISPDTVPAVNHTVKGQTVAIDHGKMDGWARIPGGTCDAASGYACISGYKPQQLPNLIALARTFAISDNTFSLADSPSWGGHMAIVAASQDHFSGDNPYSPHFPPASGWGCDSDATAPWITPRGTSRMVPSCVPDPSLNRSQYPYGGAFERTPAQYIPTIMDRLHAAGLSWRIYGAPKGATGYGIWDICPTFAECLYTGQYANLVPDARFFTAARTGKLPAFSVVTPGGSAFADSCHNLWSMTACDNWAGQLVTAVMNGPDWSSTAVFITFDDCGCFYDQVPPGINPDGTQQGPRVPLIIVSPYARPGYTDTTRTTFDGILAYTEQNFGLAPLGVNDAHAYPFTNAMNYGQAPLKPVRMVTRPLPASARHLNLTPALANDPT